MEPTTDAGRLRRMLLHVWSSGLVCPTDVELAEWPERPGAAGVPTTAMLRAATAPSEWAVTHTEAGGAGPVRLTMASRELRFEVGSADGKVSVTWLVGGAGRQTLAALLTAACQSANDTAMKLAAVCRDPSDAAAMAALDAASQVLVGRAWETLHRRLWIAAMAWWLERGPPMETVGLGALPAQGVPMTIVDLVRCRAGAFQAVAAAAAAAAAAASASASALASAFALPWLRPPTPMRRTDPSSIPYGPVPPGAFGYTSGPLHSPASPANG